MLNSGRVAREPTAQDLDILLQVLLTEEIFYGLQHQTLMYCTLFVVN